MPPRVALATSAALPDLEPDSRALMPAIAAHGVDVEPAIWTDTGIDWASYDMVVIRNTWDYFDRPEEFDEWVARVDGLTPLWNPARVVRWNAHKRYLSELASRGIPVVETLELGRGTRADLPALMREHGWDDAIFKPAVSGGALGLVRARGEDEARAAQADLDEQLASHDVLLQPFLPSIVEEGELSLLYMGGELSHTVIKRAAHGDIRVQDVWGGVATAVPAPAEAVDLAERALAEVPEELLYARVDLVRGHDGTLRLIELEVIEPSLFFGLHPPAAARLAEAIVARL